MPRVYRCVRSQFDYDYRMPCATCLENTDEVTLKMEEMESTIDRKE